MSPVEKCFGRGKSAGCVPTADMVNVTEGGFIPSGKKNTCVLCTGVKPSRDFFMFYAYHAQRQPVQNAWRISCGRDSHLTGLASKKTIARCCLIVFAAAALHGCSPASMVRTAPAPAAPVEHPAGSLAEPASNEAVIVINNNALGGNHAGIFAGARLNDPAGSYVGTRTQNGNWSGPSLADYVEFQKEDGENILIYRFRLAAADFAALDARMAAAGITPPLFCAAEVQNLIAGLGPFAGIAPVYWTSPASLADLLDDLRSGRAAPGVCVMPDNRPC